MAIHSEVDTEKADALASHVGHHTEVVSYCGESLCVECVTCGCVLIEFKPERIYTAECKYCSLGIIRGGQFGTWIDEYGNDFCVVGNLMASGRRCHVPAN